MISTPLAQTIVLAGGALAAGVWALGWRRYRQFAADTGRYRTRVPLRPVSPQAWSELVRWGTGEGRRITSQSRDRLTVTTPPGMVLELALLQETAGPCLEIATDLTAWRRRLLLPTAILIYGVAPLVIGGLVVALYTWAAPHPNPGVRWQVVQVVQCVHVLWPPWAITAQYRALRQRALDPLAENLRALLALPPA